MSPPPVLPCRDMNYVVIGERQTGPTVSVGVKPDAGSLDDVRRHRKLERRILNALGAIEPIDRHLWCAQSYRDELGEVLRVFLLIKSTLHQYLLYSGLITMKSTSHARHASLYLQYMGCYHRYFAQLLSEQADILQQTIQQQRHGGICGLLRRFRRLSTDLKTCLYKCLTV